MTTEARETKARPFFSLREKRAIVARKGSQLFPQVITEPTTFLLHVENGHRSKVEVTIYPPSNAFLPQVIYQTGAYLVEWIGNNAIGDDQLLDNGHRVHNLTEERKSFKFAPFISSGFGDGSDTLLIHCGEPVTKVALGAREFHLPIHLPQIVYRFFPSG